MSVATGIAQAFSMPGVPQPTASAITAGRMTPPTAAMIGSRAFLRSASSPTTSSRLSSRPATKKNTASRPSWAQVFRLRFRWIALGPT
jgi:hypothetical protein